MSGAFAFGDTSACVGGGCSVICLVGIVFLKVFQDADKIH